MFDYSKELSSTLPTETFEPIATNEPSEPGLTEAENTMPIPTPHYAYYRKLADPCDD